MSVITISREFGSDGDLIAARVARTLGYHLVDKQVISAILCQYGLAEFDLDYEKQVGFWDSFDVEKAERRDMMALMLNRVVRAFARHGNVVIVGRSGYAILAGLADVLHVRLQAPLEARIRKTMLAQSISHEAAAALVDEKDKVRTSFIESFYRVPWDSARAFDLAVNTSIVPIETATAWVIEATRQLPGMAEGASTTKQLEIDPVMMETVNEKLDCATEHA